MDTAILIGNTNTKIALIRKNSIKNVSVSETKNIESAIKKMTSWAGNNIYLASVVPFASEIVKKFFPSVKELTWKDYPKKIKLKEPERVGIDRLLNAMGAWSLVKSECLIIDAGSAITIDLVNKNGDFEGGVIFPGEQLIFEALKNLALLKSAEVSRPTFLIGKNTSEAIGSGITFGLSFLVSGYIEFFKKKNSDLAVIFTGGTGKSLQRRIRCGNYNKNLSIIGLQAIVYGCP